MLRAVIADLIYSQIGCGPIRRLNVSPMLTGSRNIWFNVVVPLHPRIFLRQVSSNQTSPSNRLALFASPWRRRGRFWTIYISCVRRRTRPAIRLWKMRLRSDSSRKRRSMSKTCVTSCGGQLESLSRPDMDSITSTKSSARARARFPEVPLTFLIQSIS